MLSDYSKTCKAQIFSRGQSAKVFKEVHDTDRAVCVIKNSEPYVAILKHETYIALINKIANYESKEVVEND